MRLQFCHRCWVRSVLPLFGTCDTGAFTVLPLTTFLFTCRVLPATVQVPAVPPLPAPPAVRRRYHLPLHLCRTFCRFVRFCIYRWRLPPHILFWAIPRYHHSVPDLHGGHSGEVGDGRNYRLPGVPLPPVYLRADLTIVHSTYRFFIRGPRWVGGWVPFTCCILPPGNLLFTDSVDGPFTHSQFVPAIPADAFVVLPHDYHHCST